MRKNLHNWLALHREAGVGPIKFKKYLEFDHELNKLPAGIKPNWKAIDNDLKWQQQENCHILTLHDKSYPYLLKKTHNPPPVLFVKGFIKTLSYQQIAIVGTRHPSHHGVDIAYNFAKHFANLGFVVTSGLAVGIDTASHKGVLEVKGKTVAALACGLDHIYPYVNKDLAHKIIECGGALISEFPIGVKPISGNFPSRNRVISGLSLGVLVVEAANKSGALITADLALEQGREVFAVPGSIYNSKSKGCHKLIKQGAKLVETADDALEELSGLLRGSSFFRKKSCVSTTNKCNIASNLTLDKEYLELLSYINSNVISVDELVLRIGRPVQIVSNLLMQLELQEYVLSVPGGYIRV